MAGYIGTKAVLLSTTAAAVTGDMAVGGAATISGAFTSLGIDDNAAATAMTIDASGNVGIGTSTPTNKLDLAGGITVQQAAPVKWQNTARTVTYGSINSSASAIEFDWNGVEAMRIDSSGNVLVGKTTASGPNANGIEMNVANYLITTRTSGAALIASRKTTDGDIAVFQKDGTTVGSIKTYGSTLAIGNNTTYMAFDSGATPAFIPSTGSSSRDNAIDLGDLTARFDDIYATNGTIQTSDRNEKQDIDVLNAAETAVAQACKGLLRKFRWKDAVAEKGDDARIHFGIIAQDLQDAFTAQGLDAGNYAMFISSIWWESDRIIPAVEAVAEELDEDGNVIVEAVEAVAEQTVTDTFETLEEAPEGATERTRLGVRYPELLAFIIGAM